MARQIVVDIVGDSSKFSRSARDATDGAKTLTDKLKLVGKGMVVGAGIGAFNLLSGAVGMAIGKLDEMAAAYREDQASQVLLGQALKNNIPNWNGNAAGVEAYAAAQAKLGFQDDAVRESIGQLIGITHDLSKAQELNTLAQDLARAKGIDLAQATDIISKAAVGNGKALRALGIDIAGATDATMLLDRVQQNVNGSAQAWAETSEGKTAVSQVKVQEAMEKIGKIIDKIAQFALPILANAFTAVADVVSKAMPYIEGTVRALTPVFQVLGTTVGVIFDVLGKAVQGWGVILGAVFGVIGTVVQTTIALFTGMGAIIGAIWSGVINTIKGAINYVIDIINGAIAGINKIQVHIAVGPVKYDFWGLRLGYIPRLHSGGVVPGAPGADVLTMLQAGERVLPANGSQGNVFNFNFPDARLVNGPALEEFARDIAQRLNLVGIR